MEGPIRIKKQLHSLNGKDYSAYQSLKGRHDYSNFSLFINQIPKDPYAPAHTGIYRVRVKTSDTGFHDTMTNSPIRRIAFRDFIARVFFNNCSRLSKGRRGTGNSGIITIAEPGQCILERSSVVLNDEYLEVRFFIGLPANGREIDSQLADKMLFEELPSIVLASLFLDSLDPEQIYNHVKTAEDSESLRNALTEKGLIAFVAEGSILPRRSGVDERPLESDNAMRFRSPDSMRFEMDLPNRGKITGMGIERGITLIVGGGYHGKSTLLQALEQGVYNHIPDDGREFVVSLPDSVKIRASSGRYVSNVDISFFLQNIPSQRDTISFATENASGSTSQASSIMEAIEASASVFYMDEDTCAANFMVRDKRIQELVSKEEEPITSFVDCVRPLYDQMKISTVLVMGGSGDYLDAADRVIQLKEFLPYDITGRAREVARMYPTGRSDELLRSLSISIERCPIGSNVNPCNEYGHIRIAAPNIDELIFGTNAVDLSDVEQLVEKAQTKAIGLAIHAFLDRMDGNTSVKEMIDIVIGLVREKGLDYLDSNLTGDIAIFRAIEFAAALNRLRGLEFRNRQ